MNSLPGKEVMSCQILGEGLCEQWKFMLIVTPTDPHLMLLPHLTTPHSLFCFLILIVCLGSLIYKILNKPNVSLFSQGELCPGFSLSLFLSNRHGVLKILEDRKMGSSSPFPPTLRPSSQVSALGPGDFLWPVSSVERVLPRGSSVARSQT